MQHAGSLVEGSFYGHSLWRSKFNDINTLLVVDKLNLGPVNSLIFILLILRKSKPGNCQGIPLHPQNYEITKLRRLGRSKQKHRHDYVQGVL